jgi:hypothetical protein
LKTTEAFDVVMTEFLVTIIDSKQEYGCNSNLGTNDGAIQYTYSKLKFPENMLYTSSNFPK